MAVPPCLKAYVNSKLLPAPVVVQHMQPRGVPRQAESAEEEESDGYGYASTDDRTYSYASSDDDCSTYSYPY